MNSRILARLLPLVAVAAMATGLVVMIRAEARSATFGWFAYSPLSEANGTLEGLHVFTTAGLVGALVLVVGLLVMALWVGLRVGGRRRSSLDR